MTQNRFTQPRQCIGDSTVTQYGFVPLPDSTPRIRIVWQKTTEVFLSEPDAEGNRRLIENTRIVEPIDPEAT